MLLTSRAAAFVQEAENYKKKAAIAGEADRFSTRASQLKAPSEALSGLQRLAKELAREGIAPEVPTKLLSAAAARASKHLTEFEADAKQFVEPNAELAQEFLNMLKKLEADYKDSVRRAWEQHVEKLINPLPEAVLQAIATLPAYQSQVATLRGKHADAQKLAKSVPTIGDVQSVLSRIQQMNSENDAAWHKLNGSGLPDDVQAFLRKSGSTGGASLSDVTPAIVDWLQARDLLGSFLIRVR